MTEELLELAVQAAAVMAEQVHLLLGTTALLDLLTRAAAEAAEMERRLQ